LDRCLEPAVRAFEGMGEKFIRELSHGNPSMPGFMVERANKEPVYRWRIMTMRCHGLVPSKWVKDQNFCTKRSSQAFMIASPVSAMAPRMATAPIVKVAAITTD
jgi:hypothetical protein